jgi:hypothetical protein
MSQYESTQTNTYHRFMSNVNWSRINLIPSDNHDLIYQEFQHEIANPQPTIPSDKIFKFELILFELVAMISNNNSIPIPRKPYVFSFYV